jgi:hypothetical protein
MNLQTACHTTVILEPLESFAITQQCVGRTARRGQTHVPSVFIYSTVGTYDEFVEGIAEEKALQTVVSTAALPRNPESTLVKKVLEENKDYGRYFSDPLIAAQTYLAESLYSFAIGHRYTMRWWTNVMRNPTILSKTVKGYPVGSDDYLKMAKPRSQRKKYLNSEQLHSLRSGFTRKRIEYSASSDMADDSSPDPSSDMSDGTHGSFDCVVKMEL